MVNLFVASGVILYLIKMILLIIAGHWFTVISVLFPDVCCRHSVHLVLPPQTLAVGQLVVGCISVVQNNELVVSLPHKLVGSDSLTHTCKGLTHHLFPR